MTILKWVLVIVGVLVAMGVLAYGIGLVLPRHHKARVQGLVAMPVAAVATKLREVHAYPAWRPGVTVEVTSNEDGAISWVETQRGDRIALRLSEPEPERRFVSVITDDSLPFGGQWTFTLQPQGDATQVTIEEDGEIRHPLFRFFARFVFGYESTLRAYLDALANSTSRSA